MSFSSLLDQAIAIERPTVGQNDVGGPERTFNAIGTSRCRIEELSAIELTQMGREAEAEVFRIYLPAGTDVKTSDIGKVGTTTYNFEGPRSIRGASSEHHIQVLAAVRK